MVPDSVEWWKSAVDMSQVSAEVVAGKVPFQLAAGMFL